MPPEDDAAAAASPAATYPPEASARPSALDYAPVARHRSVRRWMAAHPALMALLALAVAATVSVYGSQWQLQKDQQEFWACTTVSPRGKAFTYRHPPTRGAMRHLARWQGTYLLRLDWPSSEAKDGAAAFAAVKLPIVTEIGVGAGVDADALVKVLARPDSGLQALTTLDLYNTQVTDAGLKELTRPDSGLKALAMLYLNNTQVTDAGLKELARPDGGLKLLTALNLENTRVTDAGIAELKKARPGLIVKR